MSYSVLWPQGWLNTYLLAFLTNDDDDMTILMCAQKLTDASLIYRTGPETKTGKMKKLKNKRICSNVLFQSYVRQEEVRQKENLCG